MSNLQLTYSEKEILAGCLENKKHFQELLYQTYSKKMFGICMRYAPNREVAQDIFQEGFIKVFRSLHQFKQESALSSWMYRIFVTTSINYIQRQLKNKNEVSINIESNLIDIESEENESEHWMNHISSLEALEMVQALPEKYRLIINLYAIEKHSHIEIAEILNISETSSRSQLSRARKMLSVQLNHKMKQIIG